MTPSEVKQARKMLGLSQHQLARAINTTSRSVSRWESGERRPMPFFADAIRSLLKSTPEAQPETVSSENPR